MSRSLTLTTCVLGLVFSSQTAFAQRTRPAAPAPPARPAPAAGANRTTTTRTTPTRTAAVPAAPTRAPVRAPAAPTRPAAPAAPALVRAPVAAPAVPVAPGTDDSSADSPGVEEGGAADHTADLETLLSRLRTDNPTIRRSAAQTLTRSLEPSDLENARNRLLAPLGTSHLSVHAAMVRAVRAVTLGRENAPYDLLDAMLRVTPRGPDVDTATERVALARALAHQPHPDAGRALVAFAFAHNRIFRMEVLRLIRNTLKDYVLPALIEFRRPTDEQRMFIRQARESIRRVTPGESVQTRDSALLAEILRAYGNTRQPDAMSVVASFVNSERTQVRDTARNAIAQYGSNALNVLKETYYTFVGERADPNWGWERTARELYAASDRRRADEVVQALDQGLVASRNGDRETMYRHFSFVLSRHPLYERRAEMVAPLLDYARELERSDASRAEQIYRMALRLDPTGARANAIQSAILYLEAERALAAGVADPELYRAALRADPNNRAARNQLDAVAQVEVLRTRQRRRTTAAVGLLVIALTAVGLVLANARPRGKTPKTPEPEADPESATSTAPSPATATET